MAGATDREILDYASKNKAILVTKDLDFDAITIVELGRYRIRR